MSYKFNPFSGNLDIVGAATNFLPLTGGTVNGYTEYHGPNQGAGTNAFTIYNSGTTSSDIVANFTDNQTVSIGTNSDPDSWARFYVAGGGFRCDDDFRFKKAVGAQFVSRLGGNGFDLQFQCQNNQFVMYGAGGNAFQQSIAYPIVTKSGAYTTSLSDHTIIGTAAGTITLIDATTRPGIVQIVKNAFAGTTLVNTTNSQTIDGAGSLPLTVQNEAVTIQSDGTNWQVVGQVATTIL